MQRNVIGGSETLTASEGAGYREIDDGTVAMAGVA
jgi:hypothetical protein